MLNVICNVNDEVVDIASEKENLSRGYAFPGFKEYHDLPDMEIAIGDTFDGVTVTPNRKARDRARKDGLQGQLIDLTLRKDKAVELGLVEAAIRLSMEIQECERELVKLSS